MPRHTDGQRNHWHDRVQFDKLILSDTYVYYLKCQSKAVILIRKKLIYVIKAVIRFSIQVQITHICEKILTIYL